MTDYFPPSMKQVFGEEGAPSDNPITDPDGGLTRFGISQTQHPEVDVPGLTQTTAVAWYRANVWQKEQCDIMPWPVCLAVFDAGVNQGLTKGAELLQSALKVDVDGDIGPQTRGALAAADPWDLTARFLAKRAVDYTTDSEWSMDGEGWMYRLMCLSLAAGRQSNTGA
jgi:lysozyme family protein